jgi:XTP/dITP diphosphohydrolase
MDVFLASGNNHKFEEFVEMIMKARLQINFYSAMAVDGMPEVEESGHTLEENAKIKGDALAAKLNKGAWVLADDSGLIVDALDGAPGVHSARFAGPGGNAVANNIKLLKELRGVPVDRRTARFSCVLYFLQVGGEGRLFKGTCEGHILTAPSGTYGFGYDPLFRPIGYTKSFAELGSAKKHALSHRARAVREWIEFLQSLSA